MFKRALCQQSSSTTQHAILLHHRTSWSATFFLSFRIESRAAIAGMPRTSSGMGWRATVDLARTHPTGTCLIPPEVSRTRAHRFQQHICMHFLVAALFCSFLEAIQELSAKNKKGEPFNLARSSVAAVCTLSGFVELAWHVDG